MATKLIFHLLYAALFVVSLAWIMCRPIPLMPEHRNKVIMGIDRRHAIRKALLILIVGQWVCLLFLPGYWTLATAGTAYGGTIWVLLHINEKRWIDLIMASRYNESVLVLDCGTHNDQSDGILLRIWFKKGQQSWPPVELELGLNYLSFPISDVGKELIGTYIQPRIRGGFQSEGMPCLLSKLKEKLLLQGVTHPIDIQGWDSHPVIREFIEQIMDAAPVGQAKTPPKLKVNCDLAHPQNHQWRLNPELVDTR